MKLPFLGKTKETQDIYTFSFQRPSGFNYYPGQYCYVTVAGINSDPRGNIRQFTLSSSPTQKDIIHFTTQIGPSEYKQQLNRLVVGDQVEFDGPHGVLYFTEVSQNPNVFISGGLGITPFRSILKYCVDRQLNPEVTLINLSESDLFNQDFRNWQELLSDFVYATITSEKLYESIKATKTRLINANYWVVGPRKIVTNTENILYKLKIDPKNIRTEKFTGL